MKNTAEVRTLAARGAAEKNRLAREGKKLVALVRRLRKRIQQSSFELGRALASLKDKAVLAALGFPSFRALCDTALQMSSDLADQLIEIATSFSAAEAKRIGGTAKAVAIIDLARSLPGEHTPAGLLARGAVKVGKRTIDVRAATAQAIADEARALRAARPSGSRRGVHVAPSERHVAAALAHVLRHYGVEAKVQAIAAGKATGALLRIQLPLRSLGELGRWIREAGVSSC